jgi:trehalose-phosphatase
MSRPRSLLEAWPDVAPVIAQASRLAVFTDFDGTLAGIRRDASAVRLTQPRRQLLQDFVTHGHVVAIVSGRTLDDLASRVNVPGAWYVGDHGLLMRSPRAHRVTLIGPRHRLALAKASLALRHRLRGFPHVTIESKEASLSLHVRGASAGHRRDAGHAARDIAADLPALRLERGKRVWEFLPAVAFDKWRAAQFILRCARRAAPRRSWCALYFGDDRADERVFARWRGLSVVVGREARTAARYFVRTPADVWSVLGRLRALTA